MKSKICILHDTFLYKGGGERLIVMMGKALNSDIASGFFDKNSFNPRDLGFKGELIKISTPIFSKGLRHLKLKFDFLFKTKFLKKYETVIFSGDCISAVRNCKKDTKKIYYCHTPPRYIFDQYEQYIKKVNILLRPIFVILVKIFKFLYIRDIKKFDLILTNSKNTQKRIKEFLNLDSKILYPPVELDKFKYIGQSDYYLSFARLSGIKRVDKIAKSFIEMPDKKLIITYGKNDPQKDEIIKLTKPYKNIQMETNVSDKRLQDLIGNCISTIYIPVDEDFGMSPVESMSAGKPVIGVNDGGLKETIVDNKTGLLISTDAGIKEIKEAVSKLDKNTALSMKTDCINRASQFGYENFEKELNKIINK